MGPTFRRCCVFILSMMALSAPGVFAEARESYRWVQYGPGGLEGRTITDSASCPAATIDGNEIQMVMRSRPGDDYPIVVCAVTIPPATLRASIAGVSLPLPKPHPNRILLIGDTGCRLKGALAQACNDISQWPFRLAADISADVKPDLVLHVGDFHYRETECPLGNSGCSGSPSGDTWDAWRADFFNPAEALLNIAPWIMVRGNHEECDRGGKGWARALDPYAFDPAKGNIGCLGPAKPYAVDLGGFTMLIMDVSTADEKLNSNQVSWFREQFLSAKDIPGPVWLAFHRPIWAVDGSAGVNAGGDNETLAAAARDVIPPNVQLFVSGHLHTFMALSYVEDLPAQIISGHGGDELSPNAPDNVLGLQVNHVNVKSGIGRPHIYGFSLLERQPDDMSGINWRLTGFDARGRPIGRCVIAGRDISC